MLRHLAGAALGVATALVAPHVAAQGVSTLGRGSLFNNDLIGDGRDRWRTGSYVVSVARGLAWPGERPVEPLALREWRLRAEIVAPRRLTAPEPTDRRYAGMLSLGLHTHFARAGVEASAGIDLVALGPSTLMSGLQQVVHDVLGQPSPAAARAQQLGDSLHPTVLVEAGSPFRAGFADVRPFVELQAGIETLARVGADVKIGSFGAGGLLVRDTTTGHRYAVVRDGIPSGFSFVFGGDIAHVAGSALLPAGGAATLNPTRTRLRVGIHWQGEKVEVFYGITRLGREFAQQPVEQTVGSLSLRYRF